MRRWVKVTGALLSGLLVGTLSLVVISDRVDHQGRCFQQTAEAVPAAQAAIVLGCFVDENKHLCPMLQDRVRVAVTLYRTGKVKRLLMTGDHGRRDYDEVNAMRLYAEQLGVASQDIFLDHAGFNTWDSMVRARQVFCVQSAVVVTQDFHLGRAVFLARTQGIDAWGVAADLRPYGDMTYYQLRDAVGRCKAFAQAWWRPEPRFLGPRIPIEGDAALTRG